MRELSKPVAYDYQVAGACIADGNDKKWVDWNNELTHEFPPDWMTEDGKVTGIKPLYSQEYVSALLAELEAKDKRIAEVEGSHKKLRETLATVHNTITGGGAYTSLAGILTAVKRAYLESSDASACTVTVEGDE